MAAPPRLHKNTVAAVIEILETSFGKNSYVDKVVERVIARNPKWGARDRHFIAETSYEIVRWWRLLWALSGKEPSLKRKDLYRLFGLWWLRQGHSLPDWPAFEQVEQINWQTRQEALTEDIALRESFPQWFHDRATAELGEAWPPLAAALNLPAPLSLRVNSLKTNRQALTKALAEAGVETHESSLSSVGLLLPKRVKVHKLAPFQAGHFEVQDSGSQLIAPFLEVAAGQRVIDACAGAGGKSLHLAALMENRGEILAMDVEARKLGELEKRAQRNGVDILRTQCIRSTRDISRHQASADRLLLDVPCSGTGVIKRKVDSKWKLQPEHLLRVQKLQRNILTDYSQMLKAGGKMVYATCSILPSENEEQVQRFLAEQPQFCLVKEQRQNPSAESDGFYMALLEKVR